MIGSDIINLIEKVIDLLENHPDIFTSEDLTAARRLVERVQRLHELAENKIADSAADIMTSAQIKEAGIAVDSTADIARLSSALAKLGLEDRRSIFDYAMLRSEEILHGRPASPPPK